MRTQPKLERVDLGSGLWVANSGHPLISSPTLSIDREWVCVAFRGVKETWPADAISGDVVDAMLFAEERALDLCRSMFGRLLKGVL
jgi:hypothetical protein